MDGCELNMTVSALACAIANGKNENEITLLSVFFTQLGDSLATIAAGNSIKLNGNNIDDETNSSCIPTKKVV